MDSRDRKGGEHGVRSSTTVHGAPDQGSDSITAVKCCEQEEEIPQQEIDISTSDYQVSTEPAPGSSILASTLPPDEQQNRFKNPA
jgi:hypothetical protein